MPEIKTQTVRFSTNSDGTQHDARLVIQVYDDKDRLKRALTRLGLFWLLALGSVPIIFAHWVLVPGFLLFGPYAAVLAYRTTQAMDHAEGICPACKQDIKIKFEPKDHLPKWTYCPLCNQALQVSE